MGVGNCQFAKLCTSGYTATDKKKGQPVRVGLDSLGTRMVAGFSELVPGAGLESARLAAGDFEYLADAEHWRVSFVDGGWRVTRERQGDCRLGQGRCGWRAMGADR